jgi:hypothetical protein
MSSSTDLSIDWCRKEEEKKGNIGLSSITTQRNKTVFLINRIRKQTKKSNKNNKHC